jgi:DNA-binding SARP family transcriptional activator
MLQLQVLGSPAVTSDGGTACGGAAAQRKSIALLALLAGAGRRGLSRDRILATLWPEAPAELANHRLTQLLYSLRDRESFASIPRSSRATSRASPPRWNRETSSGRSPRTAARFSTGST